MFRGSLGDRRGLRFSKTVGKERIVCVFNNLRIYLRNVCANLRSKAYILNEPNKPKSPLKAASCGSLAVFKGYPEYRVDKGVKAELDTGVQNRIIVLI